MLKNLRLAFNCRILNKKSSRVDLRVRIHIDPAHVALCEYDYTSEG